MHLRAAPRSCWGAGLQAGVEHRGSRAATWRPSTRFQAARSWALKCRVLFAGVAARAEAGVSAEARSDYRQGTGAACAAGRPKHQG